MRVAEEGGGIKSDSNEVIRKVRNKRKGAATDEDKRREKECRKKESCGMQCSCSDGCSMGQ